MTCPENSTALRDWLACPVCRGALQISAETAVCTGCRREFGFEGPVLNLLEGARFADDPDPERAISEERKDTHTTNAFILPLVRRAAAGRPIRVLSVGCGVGKDVDLISEAGFDCVGIDCGSRIESWTQRRHPERLYIASATNLPFQDGTFDFVFSGCVLAHIGVVGDTWETTPDYWEQRLRFCSEVSRVTRKGGQIVLSGANRNFPFDIFHRDRGYMPRFHLPSEKFLVSFADYQKMFVTSCGCTRVDSVPTKNYWGFNGLRKFFVGRVCERIISQHLNLVSSETFPYLQRSFLNPWLVVKVER